MYRRNFKSNCGLVNAIYGLLFALSQYSISVAKEDIYIAGFLPLSHPTESSDGIFTAVNLALNHINNSPHILKNHTLHVLWNDTQVSKRSILQH